MSLHVSHHNPNSTRIKVKITFTVSVVWAEQTASVWPSLSSPRARQVRDFADKSMRASSLHASLKSNTNKGDWLPNQLRLASQTRITSLNKLILCALRRRCGTTTKENGETKHSVPNSQSLTNSALQVRNWMLILIQLNIRGSFLRTYISTNAYDVVSGGCCTWYDEPDMLTKVGIDGS